MSYEAVRVNRKIVEFYGFVFSCDLLKKDGRIMNLIVPKKTVNRNSSQFLELSH